MSVLVVDASVIFKWMLPERDGEEDVDRALALFDAIRKRSLAVLQPPHWLAEVAAVLARLDPDHAALDVDDLYAMEFATDERPRVYARAVELACELPHHLFDTLYHAVALVTSGARLVTADERYYSKAQSHGAIVRLRDLDLGSVPDPTPAASGRPPRRRR